MNLQLRKLGYGGCLLLLNLAFILKCWANPTAPITLEEAILKNLLQQPAIQVSLYNIAIQKGVAQSSAAPFDPVVNSDIRWIYSKDLINSGQNTIFNDPDSLAELQNVNPFCGVFHTDFKAHETIGHLDVTKKTRSGTRFLFNVDVDKLHNPLNCPRRVHTGKIALEIDQPLLRDLEYGLDRMNELANIRLIDAIRFDALQSISEQVLDTTFIYWNVVANKKNLVAQQESEARLTKLVEEVEYLIENQQLAKSDLLQPLAQLSSQIVARIAAEQAYYDSLQQLKFAMGEWEENCPCEGKRFEADEDFPVTNIDHAAFSRIFCQLFPDVYEQRFDILASMTRESVYTLLLKGAKNLELPRLDVVGRVSWTDAQSKIHSGSFLSPLSLDRPQKDLTIGIVFSTPFYRDEAKGLIRQRQAQWAQAMANTKLLKQQTVNEINKALQNQILLQDEVKKAQEAVEEYYQLLANETKKLIAGYSTLFILLSFESSLVNAIVQSISLQSELAKNIARLRFLTGTLIFYLPFKDCRSFVVGDATQLPFKAAS